MTHQPRQERTLWELSYRQPAGAAVWNSPTIDPKRHALYVGTGDSYTEPAARTSDSIMALDLKSGRVLWSVQDTGGDTWIRDCESAESENCPKHLGPDYDFGSSPILRTLPNGHQIIVAAQKSGNVLAHDPDHHGALLWKASLAETPPSAEGLIVFGGAADEKSAYFPLTTGGAAALDLTTGKRKWLTRFELPGADSGGHPRPYGQTAAGSAIPGIFFSGGWGRNLEGPFDNRWGRGLGIQHGSKIRYRKRSPSDGRVHGGCRAYDRWRHALRGLGISFEPRPGRGVRWKRIVGLRSRMKAIRLLRSVST